MKTLPNLFISCWAQAQCEVSVVGQNTESRPNHTFLSYHSVQQQPCRSLFQLQHPLREPEPLCGSSMWLPAHLSGTWRLNLKRSVKLRVGGIFMTIALTCCSSGAHTLNHLWSGADADHCHLSENMAGQRFKGWKSQRWNRTDPCMNERSAWAKGLQVAVSVRVDLIYPTWLLQH